MVPRPRDSLRRHRTRMVTAEPDITRLLARLKRLKLIRQHRDQKDRRVVWTQISKPGWRCCAQWIP